MLQNLGRDREAIVTEVRSRIVEGARARGGQALLETVNETLYLERERLRRNARLYKDPGGDARFYTTHVAAYALIEELRRRHAGPDLYKFLREDARGASLPLDEAGARVDALAARLREMERAGRIALEPDVRGGGGLGILTNAVKYFGLFHERCAIRRKGNRLFIDDANLLYYYRNRLASYDLEAWG